MYVFVNFDLRDFLVTCLWCCFFLHFFRKNEAKKRRGSQNALLTRAFATTKYAMRDLMGYERLI